MRHATSSFAMRLAPFALLVAALAVVPASAQPASSSEVLTAEGPWTLCVLHAPDADDVYYGMNQIREAAEAKGLGPSATFDPTYTGFSAQARTAFQYALDIWATHIDSAVPIKVDASFEPLGTNVLGSARALSVYANFTGAPVPFTWYGDPLADALRGQDLNPGGFDIQARFSSNYPFWYYGTDGNPPTGRVDFVSVVLHEIGHGLGFFGNANVDNGSGTPECNGVAGAGCYGIRSAPPSSLLLPVIYERFMEDASGTLMIDEDVYPNPSQALGDLLESEDLFFGSATTTAVYGNTRPPIWAPAPWDLGSSFAHFDENVIPTGNANALMTPRIAQGEAFLNPGPLTCALLQDIGWTLGPDCASLIVDGEDSPLVTNGLQIEAAGPNPFREATALRVRLGEPQAVRATLYDALGREAAVLYDGTAPSGVLTLTVSGDLAPGAYTVLVRSEEARATASLVRVR